MSISASYINTASFLVSGDRVSEFSVGRRLKIDCGVDGFVYATISSSSYVVPNTVVIIKDGVITSNIISVLYGIVSGAGDGSLPDHTHSSTEGTGGLVSFLDISGAPSYYDNTKYLRSTASGTEWASISGSSEETDPVFLASAASVITSSGIASWDEAYSWGNHANAGYLTEAPTSSGAGAVTFLELTDTPTTYSGTENMYLQSTGSGIEFVELETPASTFLDLTDTPSSYESGKYLKTTSSGVEFIDLYTGGELLHMAKMRRSTAQAVSHGVTTKVLLDDVDFDYGDITDLVNSRVVIKNTGVYYLEGFWVAPNMDSAEDAWVFIVINNISTVYELRANGPGTNTLVGLHVNTVVLLNTGDIVELRIRHFEDATQNTLTGVNSPYLSVIQLSESNGTAFSNFTDLLDTPATYSGIEGSYLQTTSSGVVATNIDLKLHTESEIIDIMLLYGGI